MRKHNTFLGLVIALVVAVLVVNLFLAWNLFRLRKMALPIVRSHAEFSQTMAKMNRNILIVQRLGIDALQYAVTHPELRAILDRHIPLLQQLHLVRPSGQGEAAGATP